MQQTKVQIDIMKVNNEIDNNHKTQSPSETYGEGAAPVFVARVQTLLSPKYIREVIIKVFQH